jgi:hypothetical protein
LDEARVFAEPDFAEAAVAVTCRVFVLLPVALELDFLTAPSSPAFAGSANPHARMAAHKSSIPDFRIPVPRLIRDNPKIKAQGDPGTVLSAQYQFPLGQIVLRKCTGQEDGSILP